jgi:enoyl-CoA hydratase/carnithine racemase
MSEIEPKVLVEYLPCKAKAGQNSSKIALITLNKPKALNALDLDMVNLMLQALEDIRNDDSVLAVMLDSCTDKAFCAGGDVVSMYHAMKANSAAKQDDDLPSTPQFLQDFFTQEYRLDYCLHTFPKPIIVWGNGIIMGGGLGLFMGSHIRLVTETARIAMPEITIGLFPDVGGSFFLNKLKEGVGLFLGLTAANLTALIEPLAPLGNTENILNAETLLKDVVEQAPDNGYLQKAFKGYQRGSAVTAHLVHEQLRRAKNLTLAECFRMELSMAFTCGAVGEFQEGVRALLIDKDNAPQWQYASISEVPQSLISTHFSRFTNKAEQSHPLAQLEQDFGV